MKLYEAAHTVYKTEIPSCLDNPLSKKDFSGWCKRLSKKIKLQEIRKYYPDWEYIELGIKKDHIHLYMVIPPKYAVSKVVETLKSNTSKRLKIKFAFC